MRRLEALGRGGESWYLTDELQWSLARIQGQDGYPESFKVGPPKRLIMKQVKNRKCQMVNMLDHIKVMRM